MFTLQILKLLTEGQEIFDPLISKGYGDISSDLGRFRFIVKAYKKVKFVVKKCGTYSELFDQSRSCLTVCND